MTRTPATLWIALVLVLTACAPAAPPGTEAADLLVLGGTVVTMDPAHTVLDRGGIAIRDGVIVAVGPEAEVSARFHARETIRARAHDIVLPGLVNGHNHVPMTLLRGVADDLALMDWLQDYIFPAESKTVDEEFVRVGTRLAALEMIRTGTTTFADMYYFEDAVAEETDAAGLRGILGETLLDFPSPDSPDPEQTLAYTRDFIQRWKDNPRIIATSAPHAPYTVSTEHLEQAVALTREFGVPILIHLAETRDEVRQIQERYDATPTGYLARIGFLGPDVIAAHAIWVNDEDIALLAQAHVGLVHNPESNMKLASGTMRVGDLRKAGIAVGLGTDGPASNNDLDLFGAMLIAPLLQKNVRADPRVLPAPEVVAMATSEGARALGLDSLIGSLQVGKRADLIVVDGEAPNLVPRYDPYSHLTYAARGDNVRASIVDGRILYLDGQFRTLDPVTVIADARRVAERVRQAVASEQ